MTAPVTIHPASLSPLFAARLAFVESFYRDYPGKLSDLAAKTAAEADRPHTLTEALTMAHLVQRLYVAAKTGLHEHPKMIEVFTHADHFPLWKDFAGLEAPEEQKRALAHALFNGEGKTQKKVLLGFSDYSRGIAEMVVEEGLADKAEMDPWINDMAFTRRVLNIIEREHVMQFAEVMCERLNHAERRVVMASYTPSAPYVDARPDPEVQQVYDAITFGRMLELSQPFTATILPTPHEAELDGISFEEYVATYFRACAVDNEKMRVAQSILIEKLNAGRELHFTNNDGTDLRLSIEGMTFLNSLMESNIPGFEVFSAPVRESVQGRVVSKGRFMPIGSDELIEDITIEFKDGRVVSHDARVGADILAREIARDEGSHYMGEIAFGTNPELTRHSTNGLIVEKIGCSFHFALGNSYKNTPDAIIHNGNVSKLHWDITTMLKGKDGKVTLDGEIIMEHGRYVDPRLAIFNGEAVAAN